VDDLVIDRTVGFGRYAADCCHRQDKEEGCYAKKILHHGVQITVG